MMARHEAIGSIILLWKTWSIHGFVLFSLCLQIFLFVASPFRKKTTNLYLVVLIWLAYLLVSTAIDRSLALILSANKQKPNRAELVDLYSLWSVFLLLHFGGPDTITALAVEDNKFWRRSWLNFLAQIGTTFFAVQAVPLSTLLLWPKIYLSALLILVAGILKSAEKVMSLANASFNRFEWSLIEMSPNPGPDYAAIVEEHDLYQKTGVPVKFEEAELDPPPEALTTKSTTAKLNDAQVVIEASHFFDKFRGMYVDMVFCCHDRKHSRGLFLRLTPEDAYRVLETEMKLAYEAFYTKTPFISLHLPKLSRWISFILQLLALVLWLLQDKHPFRPIDVKITYVLIIGAISIDVLAIIRYCGSDWNIGNTASASSCSWLPCLSRPLLFTRRRRWGDTPEKETPCSQKTLRNLFRQWSESISQFNFIDYCIYERPEWQNSLFSAVGAKDMMDGWWYVSEVWLTNDLRDFIFEELKSKAIVAKDLSIGMEVSSSRGSWILRYNASCDLDPTVFHPWIMGVEFDESLLIWHIATELCYETDESGNDENEYRRFSKILSDYCLYLLLRQPLLMYEMAPIADIIFNDTSEQARRFFHEVMPSSLPNAQDKEKRKEVHKEACKRVLEVSTDFPGSYIKGTSKSVLFEACRLAKKLKELNTNEVDQWRFTSQIWVELLSYTAAQSPASVHVMQLSKGGELVTLVRLLMLHFGLSNQFRKAKSVSRAELVVGI